MKKIAIKLIEFYQNKMSPNMNKRCRFYPSCSNYGLECYKRFNFFKASFLTLYRIIRCNPWNKGGYDPVPEKKSKLIKISDNYYILEYRENTDRPNLAYIYREDGSYIIDGGNSKKHINHFYKELTKNKLPLPKYSILTHHHWDHSFGLYYSNTTTYGLNETNNILIKHKEILKSGGIKELINQNELPKFCFDHILLEYKGKSKQAKLKLVDKLIESTFEIDNLIMFNFPSNHTTENLAILDKKTQILFLGDALCGKIVDYDFIKDKVIIKEQLSLLKKLEFSIAIESHNAPVNKEEIIKKLEEKLNE